MYDTQDSSMRQLCTFELGFGTQVHVHLAGAECITIERCQRPGSMQVTDLLSIGMHEDISTAYASALHCCFGRLSNQNRSPSYQTHTDM